MTAQILDGKSIAEEIIASVAAEVKLRQQQDKRAPTLAVVLVGDNASSTIYVRNKARACERAGIRSLSYFLSAATPEAELLDLLRQLNEDVSIDGILVQLPLPPHINCEKVIALINPYKDVDGFHPYNIGRLALQMPLLRPCTPRGVMMLLEKTCAPIAGQDAVVIGVSHIVGRPMILELLHAKATVTACHSRTQNLPDKVIAADIVITAIGRPNFVSGRWIKQGAIVIDVGINRLSDGKLCGDVEYNLASRQASWITPVPGGVGPMTVAVLMQNTLEAAKRTNP